MPPAKYLLASILIVLFIILTKDFLESRKYFRELKSRKTKKTKG